MHRREKQSKTKDLHNMPSFSSTLLDEIYRSIDGNVENTVHSKVYKPSLDNAVSFGSKKEESKPTGLPTRPKPVRTCKQGLFDDYQKKSKDNGDDLTKSKSKALKIYSHFKKMKQPISPGLKLTNFINTFFSISSGKKSKNVEKCKGYQETKSSSACSFSRSCLNKYSTKSREEIKDEIQRTVRFHPLNVNVDGDSGRSKKCVSNDDTDIYGKPPLPPNTLTELKQNMKEKNRRIEEAVQKVLEGYNRQSKNEEVTRKALQGYNRQNKDTSSMFRRKCNQNYEDDDDAMSDSSSDLFELDHLASFRNNNFSEELPVYETTQYDSSRAKFRGLIR